MRLPFRSHPVQRLCAIAASLSIIGACTTIPFTIDTKATAPVLDGFGETTLHPSQGNDAARRLFSQGMAQTYAFNRPEAIRAFKAGLAQDPECAMCAWGIALQMGPNINGRKRGDLGDAIKYIDYAVKHSKNSSARDKALIEAAALRYGHSAGAKVAPPSGELCATPGDDEPAHPLDIAYALQMQQVAERFPSDPDVLTHYAEAEMVATRGDWWDRNTGKPGGRMGDVATRIETALKSHPNHAGLNHYMIHAVDAVPVAARAVEAADRLGKLAPKSPHLLHMPSHTYGHVGRYADATRVNQLAVAADEAMMAELKKQNFKDTFDWRGHNSHFQWYAALMEGRGELSLETARGAAGRAKGDSEYGEYVRSLPLLTLLHLQRWDDLAREPMASGEKGLAKVLGNMTKGIGMARNGKLAEAKAALELIKPSAKLLLAKHTDKGFVAKLMRSMVKNAELELAAEIAFAEQRTDEALKLQADAVMAAADADRTEPPTLASGPRQRLGGMQLRAKQYAAAEQSFSKDLALHPKNGWSLNGLQKALAAQSKQSEAQLTARELAASWALADSDARRTQ